MKEASAVKKSILTAACISLCVVLPQLFCTIPGLDAVYWPLQTPVLLCGLVCGAPYGLLCGAAGTLLSWCICGTPPALSVPPLLCECAVCGFTAGALMSVLHMKKLYSNLYISLIAAMIAGKALSGLVYALIYSDGAYSISAWTAGNLLVNLFGAVVQLAFIPNIVYALAKTGLIPTESFSK